MASPQEKILANTCAVDGDFATVVATFTGAEDDLIACIRAGLTAGGYTNLNFRGFILYNNTGQIITIYTKTGQSASGLTYPAAAMLPFWPFVESPGKGLFILVAGGLGASTSRVACFY